MIRPLVGPYTPRSPVGPFSGFEIHIVGFIPDGEIVKRLGVHFNPRAHIRGINTSFSDGSRRSIGFQSGDYAELTLAPAETIRRASLWGSDRTFVTRIRIETSRGQVLDAGRSTGHEVSADVGSGILAGFTIKVPGDVPQGDIRSMALVFIIPIRRTIISDVKFTLPTSDSISAQTLSQADYSNNFSNRDVNWDFTKSVTRTNSVTFEMSATVEFGASVTVTAGIPKIAQVEATAYWTVSATASYERTRSTDVTFSWSLGGTLAPGEAIRVLAYCQHGNADVDYTATVRHEFNNGLSTGYTGHGVLKCAEYAFANLSAQPRSSTGQVLEIEGSKEVVEEIHGQVTEVVQDASANAIVKARL